MKKNLEKFYNYYIMFVVYCLVGWLYEVLWMKFVVPPFKFINRGVLFGPFLPIYGFGMIILILLLNKFMKRKHLTNNKIYLNLSIITVTTFLYTTIIEYTTPKIYKVSVFLSDYGLDLILLNLAMILIINVIAKDNKKFKKIDLTIVLMFLLIWLITTSIEYLSHFVMDKCFNIMLWDYTKDFLNVNARVNWDASRNFAIGGTLMFYCIQPLLDKLLKKIKINSKMLITILIGIPMLIDFIINVIIK